jgi:ubiquinone/menaquinone biosynthesis C-methylase UbiE
MLQLEDGFAGVPLRYGLQPVWGNSKDGEFLAMDYDKTMMPMKYDAGRTYAPEILDLGCGTGRYSGALASHFQARVVAVDPSEKMLAEARRKKPVDVCFLRGAGEAVPLTNASVDMVFISMVFHHFERPRKAFEECYRVLRPEGIVCLRAGVTDHIGKYPYEGFFPRTSSLLAAHLQSVGYIEGVFLGGGFQLIHHEVVASQVAPNWLAYAQKVAYRADSILARLTDQEFEDGLAMLRDYAAAEASDKPVFEPVDFLVLQRI